MAKPMDLSKFRNSLTKSIPGLNTGFHDPKTWISTDNYCLNYLISGDFHKGIPLGMVTVFAGESGSGKSLFCSGIVPRNAQKEGVILVMIDSENALTEKWLKNVGVDTSPDKVLRISTGQIDTVAKTVSDFMEGYRAEHSSSDDAPKVLFVVDSLGMLDTPAGQEQFRKGDMKGDLGRKAKALKALVTNVVNLIAPYEVGMVCTSHTYDSMDMYNPGTKVSGGKAFEYAASILVILTKKELKAKDLGQKGKTTHGIIAKCKVTKTRFTKPFETVEIFIPYNGGVDPYSGMFELCENLELFTRSGSWYTYVSRETGEEHKVQRKNMDADFFGMIMNEFHYHEADFELEVEDAELEEETTE